MIITKRITCIDEECKGVSVLQSDKDSNWHQCKKCGMKIHWAKPIKAFFGTEAFNNIISEE